MLLQAVLSRLRPLGPVLFPVLVLLILMASLKFIRRDSGDLGPGTSFTSSAAPGTQGAKGYVVPITVLQDEVNFTDGVCLDGSPPAYHFSPGWGEGARKWVVYLQSGAWCTTVEDCQERAKTDLGSSLAMPRELVFSGILSNSSSQNPFFYNWNIAYLKYCDGASFAGTSGQKGGLHFQGQQVFLRVVDHLIRTRGLGTASHVLLGGHSAGGLASLLHCDQLRDTMVAAQPPPDGTSPGAPTKAKGPATPPVVKCLSDGGFFPDVPDVFGRDIMRSNFSLVVYLHKPQLPRGCTGKQGSADCFFPENFANAISTPFFVLNSLYDSWFARNALLPDPLPDPHWRPCQASLAFCSAQQLPTLHSYREALIKKVTKVLGGKANGGKNGPSGACLFSCPLHTVGLHQGLWHSGDSPRMSNLSLAEIVGKWFNGQLRSTVLVDSEYPGNPTCPKWKK